MAPDLFNEAAGAELGTAVRVHHRLGRTACPRAFSSAATANGDFIRESIRVHSDPAGMDVLDRAEIDLVLNGRVLSNVGESELVRFPSWTGGPGLPGQATLPGEHRLDTVDLVPVRALNSVLASHDALLGIG